jgi:hypothetical protein
VCCTASVDFGSLHERACGPNDYELWRPANDGRGCELGVELSVKRRKIDALCYNAEKIEAIAIERYCGCTRADYVCDECYELYSLVPGANATPGVPMSCAIDKQCLALNFPDKDDKARALGELPPASCAVEFRFCCDARVIARRAQPGALYYVSRGYVRVDDTKCDATAPGALNLGARAVACPPAVVISGSFSVAVRAFF